MADGPMTPVVIAGIAAASVGLALLLYLLVGPRPARVPLQRLNPDAPPPDGALTKAADVATSAVERALESRGGAIERGLELAGIRRKPQDAVFLTLVAMIVAFAVGLLLEGLVVGLLLAAVVPVGAYFWIRFRIDRRRQEFADQLDDTLQLMASSLRAGHSLPQSLDAISKQAEVPTSEEFARVTNETRVGRDMNAALLDTASRMESEDFLWVAQAIAINRQAGGNLAEVLDGVAHTIRERNQIRRQVKALSAEGRLSALILILLPIFVGGFVYLTNPGYILKLTENVIGWAMLTVAGLLYIVGGLWMRKTIQIKF